jgi:putative NADH-flavin reductase
MKLAVFGATGPTGKEVVAQALEEGDEVVAYARNPAKLGIANDHLKVVQGELSDRGQIERAIAGADAVVSALGPRGGSRDKPLTQGMQNIVAAMDKLAVRRIVITSTLSVKDQNDKPELRARALVFLVKLAMRPAYDEIVSVAETLRASDLDWTILRMTMLNNKPKTGKVRAGYLGRGEVAASFIARADIACFILLSLREGKYLRQAPAISN